MSHWFSSRFLRMFLAGTGTAVLAMGTSQAQQWRKPAVWVTGDAGQKGVECQPAPQGYCPPGAVAPGMPATPNPTIPLQPGIPQQTPAPTPFAPNANQNLPLNESFGESASSVALSGSRVALAEVAPGYVDLAIPVTQFRLRYDSGFGMIRPDRAEFFYAKCGCFRALPIAQGGDPKAAGPVQIESNIDYQEVRPYFEWAASDRFSAFLEAPIRFLNPEKNLNESGFSDLLVGFKYAFVAREDRYISAILTTYIPTGDADRGLGTNHVSIEPGILWYEKLSDRVVLQSEFKNWAPVAGRDFSGDILRYGTALSVLAFNGCSVRVYPTAEVVGWTVLGGKQLAVHNITTFTNNNDANIEVQSAAGDTIINAKFGVRFGFGDLNSTGLLSGSDLYVGYGRSLTGDWWYKDLLRVEYRCRF